MKQIKRSELPFKCPRCDSALKSYHQQGTTRRVCKELCNGYETVAYIDHVKERRSDPNGILLLLEIDNMEPEDE